MPVTRRLCAAEDLQQAFAIARPDRLVQCLQVVHETLDHGMQRRAVGQADVAPHHGIAGGNAREIAEPARSVIEYLLLVVHARQALYQHKGQHMRQVAGCGQYHVMVPGLHLHHAGAGGLPHGTHTRGRLRVGMRERRQDDAAVAVQLGKRGLDTTALGTGNRVPRHEVGRHLAECRAHVVDHAALGTAGVGEHGIVSQVAANGAKHLLHGAERHGHQHHVGTLHGTRQVGVIAVDDAEFDSLLQVFGIASGADYLITVAGCTQGARQRTANQAGTDDAQAPDHASTLASAARKRAFSTALPTVTRRWFGIS